jgi:IPT/TIG domain
LGRFVQGVTGAVLVFLLTGICAGCGGGTTAVVQQPQAADFSVAVSSSSVTISQGGVSAPVNFSIIPQNGFSGTVQLTFASLPAGISSNPASPFMVTSGVDTAVNFGAATTASTGSFTLSAQAVSGEISHSTSLTLAIQASSVAVLPRTNFVRTDATPLADNPPGEAHHRRIVYDPAHKYVFIANAAMNRLEVISAVDQSRVAHISIPRVTSADLSVDGTTVWAGTGLNEIVAVDTSTLQVKARYAQSGISPLPGAVFDRPAEVLSLATGQCFIRLRQSSAPEGVLALWDPASNVTTNLTPAAPALFKNGLGPMARTGDQSMAIVTANDSSGNVAVFAPNGVVSTGPRSLGFGSISWVAANSSGSRFAAVFTSNGATQLLLLDALLNQLGAYASPEIEGVVFSSDDNFLYLAQSAAGSAVITVLDGHDLLPLGQVAGAAIQGVAAQIEDADETQMLFGVSNRGVSTIDAANPITLSGPAATFAAAPASTPSEGPSTGGTTLILTGQNFSADSVVKMGPQSATNVNAASPAAIQATSPASVSNGPANITAYSSSTNWLAIAPDAFSYGPKILRVLPNSGVNTGGDTIQIVGYGFGGDPGGVGVTIGGAAAIVQAVENMSAIAPTLGLDITYPFPLERITLETPVNVPGWSDVTVKVPSGSATAARSFQYLASAQSYSKPGFLRFVAYDQKRQRVYLTDIDHVEVFDLQLGTFIAALEPPGGPLPNTGLRGLSMTPDGSQLLVADFGAQSVYAFDPDTGSGSTTAVGGIPGFASSGPSRVAATSTQTVFVGLSAEGGSASGCAACLSQMDLSVSPPSIQTAPQPEVSSLLGAPLLHGNSSGGHIVLAFVENSRTTLATWDASLPGQFKVSSANVAGAVQDIASTADGTSLAVRTATSTEIRDSGMYVTAVPTAAELNQVPGRVAVPGLAMHPTGALIYQPFLTSAVGGLNVKGGVDISDARSGELRMRIILPQQLMTDVDALHGDFLTIDENGQRLFAITSQDGSPQNAALTVVQLGSVPLAIGSVSSPSIASSGGTSLTIRGSGFQSGIKVVVGGKPGAVTLVDMNTLTVVSPALAPGPQQLTLTNANGETISLDAAITAN